jgi:hypothetical protein
LAQKEQPLGPQLLQLLCLLRLLYMASCLLFALVLHCCCPSTAIRLAIERHWWMGRFDLCTGTCIKAVDLTVAVQALVVDAR